MNLCTHSPGSLRPDSCCLMNPEICMKQHRIVLEQRLGDCQVCERIPSSGLEASRTVWRYSSPGDSHSRPAIRLNRMEKHFALKDRSTDRELHASALIIQSIKTTGAQFGVFRRAECCNSPVFRRVIISLKPGLKLKTVLTDYPGVIGYKRSDRPRILRR